MPRKEGDSSEREGKCGCDDPEHLSRRNPLRNEPRGPREIKELLRENETTQIPKTMYPIRATWSAHSESLWTVIV